MCTVLLIQKSNEDEFDGMPGLISQKSNKDEVDGMPGLRDISWSFERPKNIVSHYKRIVRSLLLQRSQLQSNSYDNPLWDFQFTICSSWWTITVQLREKMMTALGELLMLLIDWWYFVFSFFTLIFDLFSNKNCREKISLVGCRFSSCRPAGPPARQMGDAERKANCGCPNLPKGNVSEVNT